MNPYRFSALLLLVAGLCLGACQQKAENESKVIATVNGQDITEAEFQQYMQLRQQREPVTDKAQQKKVLEEMIDRVLLAKRAEATGVDKDPEVRGLLQRVHENILVQSMIRKMLKDNPITDDELKERFEKEVGATHKTEYLVRHILMKNEDEAKEVITQLNGKKANFATLAKQKSIDVQSGKNGGSLGWINQGMVVPEFFESVTHLQKGATSSAPVKSDFGWHIIKVDDTRPAKIPTYEEFIGDRQTKANFYRKLQDEKIEKTVKELRTSAKIDIKTE
jgi:peptidyl-prolyl cis-trans isomerase C